MAMEDNNLINETLLQMKYARVINLLAERLKISHPEALKLFYQSETYSNLCNKANHLHNMSDAFLVDEVMMEESTFPPTLPPAAPPLRPA